MTPDPGPLSAALAGRYRIERELGRGGMATVYLAEDLRHHRKVAIKVLDPEVAAAIGPERFMREIEIAARLTHPHILPLHDSGSVDGLLYYVMPFAEGESLRERLTREPQLPLEDALLITREVADALDEAHRQGIVHRDIKPENILLQGKHALVADFGIALAVAAAGDGLRTGTGVVIGTTIYMSPEQATGRRDLDGRSDQYGLACVLYEMLTGQPPFVGAMESEVVRQHLMAEPRPVTLIRPAVPEAVNRALLRALSKLPADRFRSTGEFAAALAAGTGSAGVVENVPSVAPSLPAMATGPRRRSARVVAVAVGLVAIAIVGLWAWKGAPGPWHASEGPGAERQRARDWILVADFEGPPGDTLLAVAARELVCGALDRSRIVACVSRDDIRAALEMAGKPAHTRVDVGIARELAYRSAVRVVLEGRIDPIGRGYSAVLRVWDADSARLILTEDVVARDGDDLIPTLAKLADRLRAGLGERRGAIAADRAAYKVPTPSFEAYRLYTRGIEMNESAGSSSAVPPLREALALDPHFANAWMELSTMLSNLGEMDSSRSAAERALRYPEQLGPAQELIAQSRLARLDGDFDAAFELANRALQHNPTNIGILNVYEVALFRLGRLDESLEANHVGRRASPFGPTQTGLGNETATLTGLGRLEDARRVGGQLTWPGNRRTVVTEIAAHRWDAADSLAVLLTATPGARPQQLAMLRLIQASVRAARGGTRAAAGVLDGLSEPGSGASAPGAIETMAQRNRLLLTLVTDGAVTVPRESALKDSSAGTALTLGVRAAMAGDAVRARQLLDVARHRPKWELAQQGFAPTFLEAEIAVLGGQREEALRILAPLARQRVQPGDLWNNPIGLSAVRWLLADQFERLDRPDSAAAYLLRIVTDPAAITSEYSTHAILFPFVERRLVMLYLRLGRLPEAQRHWQVLAHTMNRPDPEIQPLMESARAALASARSMKSEGPG